MDWSTSQLSNVEAAGGVGQTLSVQGGRSEQEVKGFRQEGEEKEKRSWRRTIGAGRF